MTSGAAACPFGAEDNCVARRQLARERALPRSPRAPSPAAFEAKPRVMKLRGTLGEAKRSMGKEGHI